MATETTVKTHKFKAEVSQVLSLVINSLRFEAISRPKLLPKDHEPRIRLIPDAEARTLTVWDNGIGMSESGLTRELGTVARSGSRELIEKLQQAKDKADIQLIGQFGVGFYSGFVVADEIEVLSRAAGSK